MGQAARGRGHHSIYGVALDPSDAADMIQAKKRSTSTASQRKNTFMSLAIGRERSAHFRRSDDD
jgi:hypothetical protein